MTLATVCSVSMMALLTLRPEMHTSEHRPLRPTVLPITTSLPPPQGPLGTDPSELKLGAASPQTPREAYDHVLHAQQEAQDRRVRLREIHMQREAHGHSYIKDCETTPL